MYDYCCNYKCTDRAEYGGGRKIMKFNYKNVRQSVIGGGGQIVDSRGNGCVMNLNSVGVSCVRWRQPERRQFDSSFAKIKSRLPASILIRDCSQVSSWGRQKPPFGPFHVSRCLVSSNGFRRVRYQLHANRFRPV